MNRSPVYRKIYASLFNDPDWLTLPPNLRWLYVVMLTGSQSNSVGCYICRLSVLSEDAGFEVKQSDIDRVCSVMGIQYLIPYRILFIPNWLKWNQPDSSKVLIGYIKSLSCLPNCETVNTLRDTLSDTLSKIDSMRSSEVGFTELWNRLYDSSVYPILYPMAYPTVYQEPEPEPNPQPYPYPYPKPQPYPQPYPKPNTIAPRSDEHDAVPADLFITYPCNGSPNLYHLTIAQVNEWSMLYQGVDVSAECKKALAWIQANNKKTAKGMPKFLVSWLGRANDKGGSKSVQQRKPRTIQDTIDIADQIVTRLNEYEVANG